jgi:hypothetical protein
MISGRCSGKNLINHLLQTNKLQNYDVNYIYEKQDFNREWMCILSFEANKKKYTFIENTRRKEYSFVQILKQINPILSSIAGIH